MGRSARRQREEHPDPLPEWIRPQLTELVKEAPAGPEWLHVIKFDGYRMHARLHRGSVRLLTRTGLDWTHKYPAIAAAVAALPADRAYLDGELCGVRPDGTNSFSLMQAASDSRTPDALALLLFHPLHLDREDLLSPPLRAPKPQQQNLLPGLRPPSLYRPHQIGRLALPLVLILVRWVRRALVADVTFLTWTAESLLRQVVYQGLR